MNARAETLIAADGISPATRTANHPNRVVLTTFGSYGDLNPLISLALQLQTAGFEPIIATTEIYREKVESESLSFWPVRPSIAQMLRDTGLSAEALGARLMTGNL